MALVAWATFAGLKRKVAAHAGHFASTSLWPAALKVHMHVGLVLKWLLFVCLPLIRSLLFGIYKTPNYGYSAGPYLMIHIANEGSDYDKGSHMNLKRQFEHQRMQEALQDSFKYVVAGLSNCSRNRRILLKGPAL